MQAVTYIEKKLKYNKTELVEYKGNSKNYYEDEIKYLKESEVLKLLSGINNEFHKLLFSFLFETGARINEALQVKLNDFDLYNSTVKIHTLKQRSNKIVRILKLSDSLLKMVLLYEKSKCLSSSDYLFVKKSENKHITAQAVNKLCKKYFISILGPEYKEFSHPHTFRHSRAIQLLNSGTNIIQVKTILGHKSLMNTLVYLKYSNKDIQESMIKANETLGIK